MEPDKFQQLLDAKIIAERIAERNLEKTRTPVTVLFSDIQGSTQYFEKYGDIAGMAMVERHNDALFPVIEKHGGRVVKTIGDSIMASFLDPVGAIHASVEMQRVLEADRSTLPADEHIHIRLGLHTGLGVVKDDDVFGDIVNAAKRIQEQAEPDQILISELLLDAARKAQVQCANFGKAALRGKDEPIDVYAVAWSDAAAEQLVAEIQARFEAKLRESKDRYEDLEERFEMAHAQWRAERRKLTVELEQLEDAMQRDHSASRTEISQDLQSEVRFELVEAVRARETLEQQLESEREKFETEKSALIEQITAMQGSMIEALERTNNPARIALRVREQVEARVAEQKQDWQLQWEAERRRLTAEIERLKKILPPGAAFRMDANKRAILEKMGKVRVKTVEHWEQEFEEAKIQWDAERDRLTFQVKRLENELQRSRETLRGDALQEIRLQYEPRLLEVTREHQRVEMELESVTRQLGEERERLRARIEALEKSLPEAKAATRKQVEAELRSQLEAKLEDSNRQRMRNERKVKDMTEELESERRRSKRQLAQLEEQLREAKEAVFKAQRQSRI